MNNNIEPTKQRIRRILQDQIERNKVYADLLTVFISLGLEQPQATEICNQVFALYLSADPLTEIDQHAWKLVKQTEVLVSSQEKLPILEILARKSEQRLEKTFSQYAPYLKDEKGKIIDYGAGDGSLTQMLHDKLKIDIEGVDIRAVKAAHINIPMLQFNGEHVPIADKYYTTGILNHVLHHEINNEKILAELDRIVSHKLVIKESIPIGKTEEEMLQNMDRTFMLDYLMLRIFRNCDIPVPGTFETPEGWKNRFAKYGWKIQYAEDFGFDTPFIPMRQYLFVFIR